MGATETLRKSLGEMLRETALVVLFFLFSRALLFNCGGSVIRLGLSTLGTLISLLMFL